MSSARWELCALSYPSLCMSEVLGVQGAAVGAVCFQLSPALVKGGLGQGFKVQIIHAWSWR